MRNLFFHKKIVFIYLFLSAFCSFAFPQADPSPYGINAHIPDNQAILKINEAGIKWIRVDFPWDQIEPSNDNFNWSILDNMINEARAKGLSILANLGKTPSWANGGSANNVPPSSAADWTDFVQNAVSRYKNKIKYWSMWNEPNLNEFWQGTLDDYVNKILVPGAVAAKTVDSSCKIVGPDLAHLLSGDAKWNIWLRGILRSGGKERLDIISHHIYDREGPTKIFDKLENEQAPLIPSVQEVLQDEEVDNKPFWITETGWDSDEVGEELQSSYYLEFLKGMRSRSYINKIFFYEIIDDIRPHIPRWGILYYDYAIKKAYTTYKDFIGGKYPPDEPSSPDDDSDEDKSSDCPISTALGGQEGSQEKIFFLKHVRDSVLRATVKGGQLVKLYYQFAPEINSILMINPYACQLASNCLEPFVYLSKDIYLGGKENLEDRFLSEEEIRKALELIEILKCYACPEMQEILNFLGKELPCYKGKSLNELVLDLDFEFAILRRKKKIINE